MRHFLKLGVATTALVTAWGSLPAEAQDGTRRLGAVTVTAQRVEENLQDVPVSVTALDTEDLEDRQVLDIRDLQFQVPNINIATNTGTASAARIFLRGVGEDESRGAVDQAVGIYVDGVYIGRSVGSLFDVVDLENIEVLRGPQGTLYGRNTIGGAIKLRSVAPQMENSGEIRTTIGNNGRFDLRGTGNVQLGDSTAFRITALHRERDGFHDLIPNGDFAGEGREVGRKHLLAFRASLLHDFQNDWSAQLTFDKTNDRSDPIPDSAAPGNDADDDIFTIEPLAGGMCSAATPGAFQPIGCFTDYNSSVDSLGGSLTVKGPLFGHDFTSISAYRELEDDLSTRIGFPFTQQTDQDQLSQEFTLASTLEGPFSYLVGAYYWEEDIALDSVFVFPFTLQSTTDSIAVFGQGTYELTDRLSLTGGLRYTDESKDFSGEALLSGLSRVDSADFENLSYNITADYAFTDDVLGYAKYATGFKSGGWSADAFSPTAVFLPVDEETLDSFEAGLKTTLLNGNLRLNGTYFFNRYDDLQIGATVPGLGFTRFNVPESEIQGLEFDMVFQITDNFQINGNLGLLDAEYTEVDTRSIGGLTNNGASPGCNGVPTEACALGLDLKNAPEYKGVIGMLYTQPVARGQVIISGDIGFEDDSWSLVANSPPHAFIEVPTLVNARVKYEADAGWSVAAWVKNATDKEYYRASSSGSFTTYASDPITYGIDLGYTF